jgi:mono/diheme cytochrome c family protein
MKWVRQSVGWAVPTIDARGGHSPPYGLLICLFLLAATGCRQDMAMQPKYRKPDLASDFFPDGRSDRPIEADTVARGQLRDDRPRYSGRNAPGPQVGAAKAVGALAADNPLAAAAAVEPAAPQGDYVREFPFPITKEKLKRGQERYTIYCSMCHDRLGTGNGKVVQRGYAKPPSYFIDRLRDAPVGYVFEVITRGYGAMPDYAEQIPADDRWLIVAYVRALQASRVPEAGDKTEGARGER